MRATPLSIIIGVVRLGNSPNFSILCRIDAGMSQLCFRVELDLEWKVFFNRELTGVTGEEVTNVYWKSRAEDVDGILAVDFQSSGAH